MVISVEEISIKKVERSVELDEDTTMMLPIDVEVLQLVIQAGTITSKKLSIVEGNIIKFNIENKSIYSAMLKLMRTHQASSATLSFLVETLISSFGPP